MSEHKRFRKGSLLKVHTLLALKPVGSMTVNVSNNSSRTRNARLVGPVEFRTL